MKTRLPLFIGSSLLLALAPGPDNCFVLAQSAAMGTAAGLCVTAGLITGLCVHITLAILGVAALLERFPRVADMISALGACYLLFVAYGMVAHAGMLNAQAETNALSACYTRGILLNLSNPKVILFFVAFLPKFLPNPCPHKRLSLTLLGGVFACCAVGVMGAFAVLGGTLSAFLRENPSAAIWTGRGAALAVAAIACWILLPLLRRVLHRAPITQA